MPTLAKASPECANQLAFKMRPVSSLSGEYLTKEGEVGDCMYFLFQGIVQIYSYDECGREVVTHTLKDGSWFGEAALLDSVTQTATAESITVCSLFVLSKAAFDTVRRDFPEFSESCNQLGPRSARMSVGDASSGRSAGEHLDRSSSSLAAQVVQKFSSFRDSVSPYIPILKGVELSSTNWKTVSHAINTTTAFKQARKSSLVSSAISNERRSSVALSTAALTV